MVMRNGLAALILTVSGTLLPHPVRAEETSFQVEARRAAAPFRRYRDRYPTHLGAMHLGPTQLGHGVPVIVPPGFALVPIGPFPAYGGEAYGRRNGWRSGSERGWRYRRAPQRAYPSRRDGDPAMREWPTAGQGRWVSR